MPRRTNRRDFDAEKFTRECAYKIARKRWLCVNEIERILDSKDPLLPITKLPPKHPPQSGSLILYDRLNTRNYKDDGHIWVKKRNSPKVREDHVKLRVDGRYRVAGCYVHSATTSTMHRRAYHLLDPNAAGNNGNNSNKGNNDGDAVPVPAPKPLLAATSKAISTLVLVHYMDTVIAEQVMLKTEMEERLGSIPHPLKNNVIASSEGMMMMMTNPSSQSQPRMSQFDDLQRQTHALSSKLNSHRQEQAFGVSFPNFALGPTQQQNQQHSSLPYENDETTTETDANNQFYKTNNLLTNIDPMDEDHDDLAMLNNYSSYCLNHQQNSSSALFERSRNSSDASFYEFMNNTFDTQTMPMSASTSKVGVGKHPLVETSYTHNMIDRDHISHEAQVTASLKSPYGHSQPANMASVANNHTNHNNDRSISSMNEWNETSYQPNLLHGLGNYLASSATESGEESIGASTPPAGNENLEVGVLPEVVDITPDYIAFKRSNSSSKKQKIVISLSGPSFNESMIDSTSKNVYFFIVFCSVLKECLSADDLHVSVASEVNPYTYKCELSKEMRLSGMKSAFLIGMKKEPENDSDFLTSAEVCAELMMLWKKVIDETIYHGKAEVVSSLFAWRKIAGICFLSQISNESVEFEGM